MSTRYSLLQEVEGSHDDLADLVDQIEDDPNDPVDQIDDDLADPVDQKEDDLVDQAEDQGTLACTWSRTSGGSDENEIYLSDSSG